MPIADGVYVLVEDKAVTTLQADTTLSANVKKFESEGSKPPEQYNVNELPAVVVQAEASGSAEEDVSIGGLFKVEHDLTIFVVTAAGDKVRRRKEAKNIAARVETVLRKQYGGYQLSDLDTVVPNAERGSVVVTVRGTEIVDNGEEGHAYRALAKIDATVAIDINAEA